MLLALLWFYARGVRQPETFETYITVLLVAGLMIIIPLYRQPLSSLLAPLDRWSASGEINSRVDDPHAVIDRIAGVYGDGTQDRLDGLTVDYGDWWFNVRPSNTEPLLRLNLEARTREQCDVRTAEVLGHIRSE
jgi:phosphomannomutase